MDDESKRNKVTTPQEEDEAPAIYSLGRVDGETTMTRRTFLELAAVAAASAPIEGGCASMPANGPGGPIRAHKSAITALAIDSTGKLLASADKDGKLKLWQLPEGALLHTWSGPLSSVAALAFPGKGDTLWVLYSTGALWRWKLPEGKEIFHTDADTKFRVRKSNRTLAVPSAGDWYALSPDRVELRDRDSGEKLKTLEGFEDAIQAMATDNQGSFLLAGGATGKLALWTGLKDSPVLTIEDGLAAVTALAVAPNGVLALSAHADSRLRMWHLPELMAGKIFESSLGKPVSVAIRPQVDLFVVGSEKPDIGLWQLQAATTSPQILAGHSDAVRATVITPDGSLLASAGDDRTIRLWSLPDGKYLRNLVDLAENYKSVEGAGYKATDVYGRTVTFTLPCGSPIPAGAVCTCNCVPGAMSVPQNHTQRLDTRGYCSCDLICTCNTVCTCQSVGSSGRYVSYWYPN